MILSKKLKIKQLQLISQTFSSRACTSGLVQKFSKPHISSLNNINYVLNRNQNFIIFSRQFASLPSHKVIKLPNLSPTMETGTVISWAKTKGDQIMEGDLLAEIETDKATMALDATDEGFLAKILIEAGTKDVPVGTPLCVVVEEVDSVEAFKDFKAPAGDKIAAVEPKAPAAAKPKPTPVAPPPPSPVKETPAPATGDRIYASPLARRLANEKGLSLQSVGKGSGMMGSIVAADLDKAASAVTSTSAVSHSAPAIQSSAGFVDMPLSSMRSVITKRLTQSKTTIPHYYLTTEVNTDEIALLRKNINDKLKKKHKGDGKPLQVSLNDVIIKAAGVACAKVPECNSSWQGDFIRQYNSVDVCVAVATPNGLITPIVFGAQSKNITHISSEVKELALKAKQNKLRPEEFQGGTFTISNLGMFGISSFSAVINPPQSCILAVGNVENRLLPCSDSVKGFKTSGVCAVTLCCDHRVVDGAVGAQWLQEFKACIEDPGMMLM